MALISSLPNSEPGYDLCVVGAGPVGLALALEAQDRGLRVLVLEAGALDPAQSAPDWSGSTVVDPMHHAPMAQTVHTGLGGTSWLWGGRCVPFEAIDFEERSQLPSVRWPLAITDVQPWYGAAARYLGCGGAEFRRPLPAGTSSRFSLGEVELTQIERWAKQPRLVGDLGRRVVLAPSIDLLVQARVLSLLLDDDGQSVHALRVRHGGADIRVQARFFVLAGGALGNTQLLLQTQRERPTLWGGSEGPLGRYYMGHVTGSIARIVLNRPQDIAPLEFSEDPDGSYVRRRFTPNARVQHELGLLNTSFYLDNPPFHDERHRNPTLSLVFLALAIAPIGRLLVAEEMRLKHIGPGPHRYGAHIWNVLRRPWEAVAQVGDILRKRYWSKVRKPGFILRNRRGMYALVYHAEQLPNPLSRVSLRNPEGDLQVDFRFLREDAESVLKAHELLDRELRASGMGYLDYERPPELRLQQVLDQALDGFHQIGTTRMSEQPDQGVVDRNSLVHGVDRLAVASSSVFCSSGEANPTFLAVALGVRLAHHLAGLLGVGPGSAPVPLQNSISNRPGSVVDASSTP
ncbi:MAG: FAD-binding protein [Burkholderiales bacterium]|nr:FAD-binding protein [Burkholderiales bacterium]